MSARDFTRKIVDTSITDDYFEKVSAGEIEGASAFYIFGENPDIDTSSSETIWEFGDFTANTAGDTQYYISSSDASDNMDVLINVIKADGSAEGLIVSLNGQTEESIPTLFENPNNAIVLSDTQHQGEIYIYNVTGNSSGVPNDSSSVKEFISTNDGMSRGSSSKFWIQIPSEKRLSVRSLDLYVGKNKDIDFFVQIDSSGVNVITKKIQIYQSSFELGISPSFSFNAGDVLELRGSTSNNNTSCSVVATCIMYDVI